MNAEEKKRKHREYMRTYLREQTEEQKQKRRDRARTYSRERRLLFPEKMREQTNQYHRKWRKKHPEAVRATKRRYYQRHPERRREECKRHWELVKADPVRMARRREKTNAWARATRAHMNPAKIAYRKRSRLAMKAKAVAYKGGKCQRCGYDRCIAALEFHHRDRTTKGFHIGYSFPRLTWVRVQVELEKCDLLCANCHREIEASDRTRIRLTDPAPNRTPRIGP